MTASPDWPVVLAAAAAAGWTARVVPVERLHDVRDRVAGILGAAELPGPAAARLAGEVAFEPPNGRGSASAGPDRMRSVVVAAAARPLTLGTLTIAGERHAVPVPPHYAGYHTAETVLRDVVAEALAPSGFSAATVQPPLKTLAACSGLARYGRNTLAYVPGLGSYLVLAACASDAPPPHDAVWGEPRELDRCARCSACLRACPSGAIRGDRFLLQTDRCLAWVNEDEAPFPEWVDPAWHHCAVGCLRCQQACPENATVELRVSPPEVFDEADSAAILAATPPERLSAASREKLAACGLDYSPALIARNLRALLNPWP